MPYGTRIRPADASDRQARFRRRLRAARARRAARSTGRPYVILSAILGLVVALAATAWIGLIAPSPWSAGVTVRHLLASPSCERARAVGLVPSFRGEPGYWERHDRDGDGVACDSHVYHR